MQTPDGDSGFRELDGHGTYRNTLVAPLRAPVGVLWEGSSHGRGET